MGLPFDKGFAISLGLVLIFLILVVMLVLMILQLNSRARGKATARLNEQREWFRTTLGSIGDGVIATDTQGRVTFLNAVAENLTGWKQEEVRGLPLETVFRIVNENTRQPVENPAVRALKEGMIVGLANHTIIIAKNGTETTIDDSAAPIREEKGTVVGVVLVFRDVTERRRTEQALAISEARKAAVLRAALDAIITIDMEGRIVEFNPAAEALFGYGHDAVVGQIMGDLIVPPRLRESHHQGMVRLLATGVGRILNTRLEMPACRADGSEFWVELTITRIDGQDRPLFTGFLRDITERRQANEALEKQARLAEMRADISAALALGEDIRTVLQRCVEILTRRLDVAFARVWTLNEAENVLELQASAGLYTHKDGPHSRVRVGDHKIGRIAQDRRPHLTNDVATDPRVSDPDWARREGMVAFAGYPLMVEDRVVGVMALFARQPLWGTVLDDLGVIAKSVGQWIDRKRSQGDTLEANRRLQESGERFRFLAESMPQKIFTATPTGEVDYFNRQWMEFTGLTFEQIKDWGWTRFVHPDDLEENVRRWRHAIDTGQPFQMEHRFRRADGVYRWHLSRAHAMRDARGEILMWTGSNTDIDDVKRDEEALRDADRKKDEFLATLAHELRNPLAPIRNALQILRLTGSNPDTFAEMRDIMERQLDQLIHLVDDLLDVSRITSGKIELRLERVDLAAVAKTALETSRPLIEAAKHELTVNMPAAPLLVEGDQTRLAQVISNLLNNSAKYTPEAGHIWLSVDIEDGDGHWPRSPTSPASCAVIRVRDNGMGIPADMVPKIFEMFTQGERTLDRARGGLGIGLTLVRRLIDMHGGTVQATSAGIGKGSEFVVRLPMANNDPTRNQTMRPLGSGENAHNTAGRRILVVDDNLDSAESLGMLLRIMGHEVRTAHDGPSALESAKEFRPSVVLLDIGLPGMNGHEVARGMRQIPELKDAVLVAQTGWGQEEDLRRSSEAGFNAHLIKPVDPAALSQLLAGLTPAPSVDET